MILFFIQTILMIANYIKLTMCQAQHLPCMFRSHLLLPQPYEAGASDMPILHVRKMRLTSLSQRPRRW